MFLLPYTQIKENRDSDPDLRWFVNKLLSCLEYEHFHRLVSSEMGVSNNKLTNSDVDLLGNTDIQDEDEEMVSSKYNSK